MRNRKVLVDMPCDNAADVRELDKKVQWEQTNFNVRANETAYILSQHTDRSLIILDEIGRGTSTYDGLSIAWAVVEHLHRGRERGPRTLFATHYQELTQLEKHLPRLLNLSVAVKEWTDDIVFVRRVHPWRCGPQLPHTSRPASPACL